MGGGNLKALCVRIDAGERHIQGVFALNKKLASALALGLLLVGGNAFAVLNTIDVVPAATLLLPYFQVDLNNDLGVTTLFSVNNASAAPTVVHVTLWSQYSVPTIDFDIFLTGYDVQTVNMRDVFNGVLPQTADDAHDTATDLYSPHGDNPVWDGNPIGDNCVAFPYGNPAFGDPLLDFIRTVHQGLPYTNPSPPPASGCYGPAPGRYAGPPQAGTVVGYVTMDNVNQCNVLFPDNPLYYSTQILSDVNQLWGDFFIVDPTNAFAEGDQLVHIEADDPLNRTFGPGDYTFYGRYNPVQYSADDHREALASTWGVRFLNGGVFTGGTDLLVWRDPGVPGSVGSTAAACASVTDPAPFPLNQLQVVAFNEQEDASRICRTQGGSISPTLGNELTCFPFETQRVSVGTTPLNLPAQIVTPNPFGWLYLNLGTTLSPVDPTPNPPLKQAYVVQLHSASGLFSVGYMGLQFDNVNTAAGPVVITGVDATGGLLQP